MSNSNFTTSQDNKWIKRFEDLTIELVGFLVTSLITFLLAQKVIKFLESDAIFWLVSGFVAILGYGFFHFFRKSIRLKKKFNIQQIYPNREACKQIIQENIKNSSTIKLFLLIGSDFYEDSGIFKQAFQEKSVGNAKVQIIVAAPDSPFFSEKRINYIKNDKGDSRKRILSMLDTVERHLVEFKKQMRRKGIAVDWRKHKETFLCKLHLFDDCVIFCFNIATSDNDNISPYFVVQKNKNSIYHAFDMYFDFVWNKSDKPQRPN